MKISIIIPCYNVESFVEECLESVFRQTHKDWEVICINDGSKDDTLGVLRSLQNKFKNQFQIIDQINKGQSGAINTGIEVADGEYLQFLDADDLLKPNKLEHQVDLIIKNNFKKPDIIAAAYEQRFEDGRTKLKKHIKYESWEALVRNHIGITSSNLWRKDSVKAVSGWDENLPTNNDHDLIFRMMKNGASVLHDPEPLTIKREREEGSLSANPDKHHLKRKIIHWYNIYKYAKENELLEEEMLDFINIRNLIHLKRVSENDPTMAIRLHTEVIPAQFKIQQSKSEVNFGSISRSYRILYNLLGFSKTERMRKYLGY